MDLDKILNTDDAQPMTLTHPVTGDDITDKDGKPITIMLHGHDSGIYKSVERKNNQRVTQHVQRTRDFSAAAGMSESNDITLLVAVTVGWSAPLCIDGQDLQFSAENARRAYEKAPWIKEQVWGFVHSRVNFTRPSPTSSAITPKSIGA